MVELDYGLKVEVERGPDWLFVRIVEPPCPDGSGFSTAETLWELIQRHFAHRVVLELDQLPLLNSALIGQLVLLHKRIGNIGGVLRVCGLSEAGRLALRCSRLDGRLYPYQDRAEAVLGHRPTQPR